MGTKTNIAWCDSTASPWYGCTKVSAGCSNCYAEGWAKRGGKDIWGKGKPRQKSKSFERDCRKLNFDAGYKSFWANQNGKELPENPKVFPSLCDWLDPEVPAEWLADMLRVMNNCPNLNFLLLTKRPELWAGRLIEASVYLSKAGLDEAQNMVHQWVHNDVAPPNIWLGTSVENNDYRKRIADLLKIPAKVHFLSLEPLLGPIELDDCFGGTSESDGERNGINWVIVGGESGPKARPCNIEWIRSIVRQCKAAGVPCFVKQLGSIAQMEVPNCEAPLVLLLKHPKGGDMAEWPEDLIVREMP